MKCAFEVSVAKHGIIFYFNISDWFFFKWTFSWGTADLPETNYMSEWCRMLQEKLTFKEL